MHHFVPRKAASLGAFAATARSIAERYAFPYALRRSVENKWHGAQAPTRKVRVRAMMECVEDEVDDDADYDDVVDDG